MNDNLKIAIALLVGLGLTATLVAFSIRWRTDLKQSLLLAQLESRRRKIQATTTLYPQQPRRASEGRTERTARPPALKQSGKPKPGERPRREASNDQRGQRNADTTTRGLETTKREWGGTNGSTEQQQQQETSSAPSSSSSSRSPSLPSPTSTKELGNDNAQQPESSQAVSQEASQGWTASDAIAPKSDQGASQGWTANDAMAPKSDDATAAAARNDDNKW